MLSKCKNPDCNSLFRYLEGGRLFVLEDDSEYENCRSGRFEYFWLCDDCCGTMTLRLLEDSTVAALRLADSLLEAAADFAVNGRERKGGLVLHSIHSLLLKPIPPPSRNRTTAGRDPVPYPQIENTFTALSR